MENKSTKLADYQRAYRKLRVDQDKKGFIIINLSAYIIVNSLLITINLSFVPEFTWFIFPLIGWGIGLTMHYMFGVRYNEWQLKKEEAKAEHLAKDY